MITQLQWWRQNAERCYHRPDRVWELMEEASKHVRTHDSIPLPQITQLIAARVYGQLWARHHLLLLLLPVVLHLLLLVFTTLLLLLHLVVLPNPLRLLLLCHLLLLLLQRPQ